MLKSQVKPTPRPSIATTLLHVTIAQHHQHRLARSRSLLLLGKHHPLSQTVDMHCFTSLPAAGQARPLMVSVGHLDQKNSQSQTPQGYILGRPQKVQIQAAMPESNTIICIIISSLHFIFACTSPPPRSSGGMERGGHVRLDRVGLVPTDRHCKIRSIT